MTTIERVGFVRARLREAPWEWAERNGDAIRANWTERLRRTPKIFDGRVLMLSKLCVSGETADATFFPTDYAALLAWTDAGWPDGSVANAFATGALRTTDGAFILGEMAPGTANAGRLYFPCGTPDMTDVLPDGTVDLPGSLEREITEETRLGPDLFRAEPNWTIVRSGGLLAFIRIVRLELTGAEARARILAHLRTEPEPELSGIMLVRSADDLPPGRAPGVVEPFLRAAFGP